MQVCSHIVTSRDFVPRIIPRPPIIVVTFCAAFQVFLLPKFGMRFGYEGCRKLFLFATAFPVYVSGSSEARFSCNRFQLYRRSAQARFESPSETFQDLLPKISPTKRKISRRIVLLNRNNARSTSEEIMIESSLD